MNISEALPWLNLLMLPMVGHIMRTGDRLTRLETQIELLLKAGGVKP